MNHYFKGLITGIMLSISAILFSASTNSSQLGRYVLNTNPIEGSSGDLHLIDSMRINDTYCYCPKYSKKNNLLWKNLYSGVFRDLDEVLIPLGIVVEAGRLPLKRGPKALQEKGIPYYHLTPKGLLVVLSIDDFDQRNSVLDEFLSKAEIKEKEFVDAVRTLVKISPKFTYSMFEIYVRAFL